MSEFNFNSQIATSIEQSKRLLALGLKKETADMWWMGAVKDSKGKDIPKRNQHWWLSITDSAQVCGLMQIERIPAWSLHRLLSLYNLHYIEFMNDEEIESMYDIVIDAIEQSINEVSLF